MSNNNGKKLTIVPLILMVFTSVYGFANIPRAFYLMGYAAIPWYILAAITFFIPFAYMMAEYGAAFKNESGGIYSWMEKSVGPKYAFIGTFMWYSSYIIWMVNICSSIWIPFSNAIFGVDKTSTWSFFGLGATKSLGILGVIWMITVTFIATKGIEKIKKVTSVGGTAVSLLNVVLWVIGILILILNKGKLSQPITGVEVLAQSPNVKYTTLISSLSFVVFAVFAYGGIEVVGGLVDQTEDPERTFPKGVSVSALIISVGYSLGIFICGIFTNWSEVLSSGKVHMGNVAYVVMNNLGYQLGMVIGASKDTATSIGALFGRFTGISMFLALTGAFFTLSFSPLKQIIEGTPTKLWPGKIGESENGIPKNAMWAQCIIVVVMVALISMGGEGASKFFEKLVLMTNVAMTIPYMFLSAAFVSFKRKSDIVKPFEVYKSEAAWTFATIVVTALVGFANFFTIIEPAVTSKDYQSTIWMIAGPLFFTIVALSIYFSYERKSKI